MKHAIPTIQSFMSTCPHTVGLEQPLEAAEELMHKFKIRHLPVLNAGKLSGVITDRDIKLCRSLIGGDDPKVTVGEVCAEDVYSVSPSSPLNEVAQAMAQGKYGSAVVLDNHKVVGIFTTVDAMKAIAGLLESRLK